jgi:hypothetical protein
VLGHPLGHLFDERSPKRPEPKADCTDSFRFSQTTGTRDDFSQFAMTLLWWSLNLAS